MCAYPKKGERGEKWEGTKKQEAGRGERGGGRKAMRKGDSFGWWCGGGGGWW